ncbi:MAG: hypothetical protein JNM98_00085 [Rhodocyclaceae bacterium]|nr:hypothetical protein [Rhodocyclaceae bacterium]
MASAVCSVLVTCAQASSVPGDEGIRQPVDGGRGGFGLGFEFDLSKLFGQQGLDPELTTSGPRTPPAFRMHALDIRGFVRGGWPLVLAWTAAAGTRLELIATAQGVAPYRTALTFNAPPPGKPHIVVLRLPERFGEQPIPGNISLRAQAAEGAERAFELRGIGAGPLAVGSVAIDDVSVAPTQISLRERRPAFYGFHSKSDFQRAAVEFLRVTQTNDQFELAQVRHIKVEQAVTRDAWIGRNPALAWDGKDGAGRDSFGPHLLQVRAWTTAQGDWVVAWSERPVVVAP